MTESGDVKVEKKSPKSGKEKPVNDDANATSTECEIIDLSQAIRNLSSLVKEDKYLLVSTMKWEDNILVDLNQAQTTVGNSSGCMNQANELIHERIKYAGWIPSGEHRTLHSYQSKVLGKWFIELFNYK